MVKRKTEKKPLQELGGGGGIRCCISAMIYVDGCFMIMMTNPHTQTDSTRTWPYREGETRADEWMDGDGLIFKKKTKSKECRFQL
jgi:hypothetical protein